MLMHGTESHGLAELPPLLGERHTLAFPHIIFHDEDRVTAWADGEERLLQDLAGGGPECVPLYPP